jgi:predicted SnoaL-like aldol condensation-catalyzing enzyme
MEFSSMNDQETLKDCAVSFLQLASSGKALEAFDRYIGQDFRHHNPYFKGDANSLRDAMQENATRNPEKILEIKMALQDGETVAVYSRVQQSASAPNVAVVHIFRFEHGKIVELWDVGQVEPENFLNENGMF